MADDSAFCTMLQKAGLQESTIQHILDNGINSLFVLKIVDFQAWPQSNNPAFALAHCDILNMVKAWAIYHESDDSDENDDDKLVTSFTRASFLQFVRAQGELSKKRPPSAKF